MRRLLTLNVLDAFITGAYTLVIPLLLVERGIDVATIGVVFSIYPLAILSSRLLFASAADATGLGRFFNMNAAGNVASVALYAVSSSPLLYALAKGVQGLKEASLWAVNRNATYEIAQSKNPYVVATVDLVRALAIALGALASGFVLFLLGFKAVFIVLAVLSALIFVPARRLNLGLRGRLVPSQLFKRLDPRLVDREVWRTSLVLSCHEVGYALVFGFILPIFLWSRGLGYWEIGMVIAMYSGVGAFLLPLTLHRTPSTKNIILAQSLLYIPAAVLVPISESWFLIMMIAIMAFGDYASYITWEQLVSHSVMGYENVATTIGLLLTPAHLTMIVAYAIAGLLVDTFGYVAPFWMAGTFFLVYSLGAWSILKNRKATADSPQPC